MKPIIGWVLAGLGGLLALGAVANLLTQENQFSDTHNASKTIGGIAISLLLLGIGLSMALKKPNPPQQR